MEQLDVVIVGGGPAAIGAAGRLRELGIRKLALLEREAEIGGIPRHCGHLGFGWQSHRHLWRGPRFAAELRREADGLDVRTGTTVREIHADGRLAIRNAAGPAEIKARAVLLATGTREKPRSSRLIGGTRPMGVMNTGTLQQHVYLHGYAPFRRPIIVGAEWVSYSAILTCRHLGIRPVAMLAPAGQESVPRLVSMAAGLAMGIPLWRDVEEVSIAGVRSVDGVSFRYAGEIQKLPCDGVIVSGEFRPETMLAINSPFLFIAGNARLPLKASGRCWIDGRRVAEQIAGRLT